MIDVHCHFDLAKDPEKFISDNEKRNLITIGMTNLPSHFQMGIAHINRYKYIRLALGLHPLRAKDHALEYPKFLQSINDTSYIGEVGLDFSTEGLYTKEVQIKSFEFVLESVKGKRKILSLHSRRAERETLEMLIEKKINNAIFHWYSGQLKTLKMIANSGYFFSVNSAMTNSINGQRIIAEIPKELMLTETDFPFIKNSSIQRVHNYLSELWDVPEIEVETIIKSNFKKLITNIKRP